MGYDLVSITSAPGLEELKPSLVSTCAVQFIRNETVYARRERRSSHVPWPARCRSSQHDLRAHRLQQTRTRLENRPAEFCRDVKTSMVELDGDRDTHKLDQFHFSLPEDLLALATGLLLSVPSDLDLAETLENFGSLQSIGLFECFVTLQAYGWSDDCV